MTEWFDYVISASGALLVIVLNYILKDRYDRKRHQLSIKEKIAASKERFFVIEAEIAINFLSLLTNVSVLSEKGGDDDEYRTYWNSTMKGITSKIMILNKYKLELLSLLKLYVSTDDDLLEINDLLTYKDFMDLIVEEFKLDSLFTDVYPMLQGLYKVKDGLLTFRKKLDDLYLTINDSIIHSNAEFDNLLRKVKLVL